MPLLADSRFLAEKSLGIAYAYGSSRLGLDPPNQRHDGD